MITLVKQPDLYTPVQSPVIFQLSSSNPGILYFGVQILDAASSDVIANQRYYTIPNLVSGTAFDLSSILTNLTNYQLVVSTGITAPVPDILQAYKLSITETIISGTSIVSGSTLVTDAFKVWNGGLTKSQYNSFEYTDYLIAANTGATIVNYLSDKPNYAKVHYNASDYLYVLNKDLSGYTIDYKFYNRSNYLIGSYSYTGSTYDEAFRINVSPKVISDYFTVDISDVKTYTVQLKDLAGLPKTQLRFYQYEQLKCTEEAVELIFANALGGFDTYSFYNPKESISVDKTTINKYPFGFDDSGDYVNISNGIYNSEVDVINVESTSTYTVISKPLNDKDSAFLKQLIQSPKAYIKLANGDFLPINITTNSYDVGRTKYSSGLIRLELQFTAPTGIDIIINQPYNNTYSPPNFAYIEVDGYCYPDDDTPEFGYVEPDEDGDVIIEDGI